MSPIDAGQDQSALASFLPATQRSLLARPHRTRLTVSGSGAALFADVVGFSELVGRYAGDGPRGAEAVSRLIDGLFGRMTDLILDAGGDVLVYAGDAVLAVWSTDSMTMAEAVGAAAGCARALHHIVVQGTLDHPLRLRAAVGAGSLDVHQVGGLEGAWLCHATGAAIAGATAAAATCAAGHTVATAEAWSVIVDRRRGAAIDGGVIRLDGVDLGTGSPPGPRPEAAWSDVRQVVPRVVADRIGAGLDDWLGEFRSVSIGFASLITPGDHPVDADRVPEAVVAIQRILHRYGGQTYQLVTDDKGTTFLYTFGLPPEAHEDDPHRAVVTGMAIQAELGRLGLAGAIGITTAVTYAGIYGRPRRRQYSVVGPSVNLAARLMAAAPGEIWCDATTAAAASGRTGTIAVEEVGLRSFKGFSEPVRVFRPVGGSTAQGSGRHDVGGTSLVVGRVEERARLATAVAAHGERGAGGSWLVSGEAGMGKSRLLAEVRANARERGMVVFRGAGDAIESATPYFAWRETVRALVDRHPAEAWPAEWSLLGPPLGRPVVESPELAGLSDELKAERRGRLLLSIVEEAAARERLVLAFEDLHWFDPVSLDLLVRLVESPRAPLIVATGRPAVDHAATERFAGVAGINRIDLAGLDRASLRALAGQTLGAATLADAVVSLIEEKSDGNPLFIEQLALMLRDIGVVVVDGGTGRLEEARGEPGRVLDRSLGTMGGPPTVQAIITSRVDRLSVDQQLVVKIASVIGRVFDIGTLRAACPIEIDDARLAAALGALSTQRLIEPDPAGGDQGYWFGHAITQDVVYGGLPFARRTEIHGLVAQWLERSRASQPSWYPRLAHHWAAAGDAARSARYYRLAGTDALKAGANAAAANFLGEAIRLEEAHRPFDEATADDAGRRHRAETELMLGKAYRGLSRNDRDLPHFERGVALLGFAAPRFEAGHLLGALREAGRQWVHRLTKPGEAGTDRVRLLAAAAAYEGLAESYFWTGRQVATLHACLRSLNLAERAGPSPELARGYASVGAVVGLLTMRRLSRAYGERALATARAVDPAGALPWVAVIVALARASEGDWPGAVSLFEEAESIAKSVGDWRRWADAAGHLGNGAAWAGRVDEGLARWREVATAAAREKDSRYEAGSLCCVARLLVWLGRDLEAELALERTGELLRVGLRTEAAAVEAERRSVAALIEAGRQRWDRAVELATSALVLTNRVDPATVLYSRCTSLLDVAAVAVLATEASHPEGRRLLETVSRSLRRFARVHGVVRPGALRVEAIRRRVNGDRSGAGRLLGRAVSAARAGGMEVEASLAELELARHVLPASREQTALVARATARLQRFGLGLTKGAEPSQR